MRITPDTNLLVRLATRDDQTQARIAYDIVSKANEVIIPLPCILEFVWVLESVYGFGRDDVSTSIQTLAQMHNVTVDGLVVDAGLRIYAAGGDFADGVIAAAGVSVGSDKFVSFDRKAVKMVNSIGVSAELASAQA